MAFLIVTEWLLQFQASYPHVTVSQEEEVISSQGSFLRTGECFSEAPLLTSLGLPIMSHTTVPMSGMPGDRDHPHNLRLL